MTSAINVPPLGEDDLDVLQVAYRRRRLARFSSETLLWLAAVPEWPVPLAQECRFPTGDAASLADLVQQLVGAGLAEQRESIEESGELITAFWLSPSRRPEVGGYLRQTLTSVDLSVVIREISGALNAASTSTQRWAQVEPWLHMYQVGQDPSGARLNHAVDGLIRDGRTQHALQLVAAAQAVGDVVGEPLVSAARRATWRLDRAYRQAMDVRMLADYLPRQELEDVLEQLLDGRLPVLHLLGQGGVGKTMVVRSLASGEFARRQGRAEFPVARIDFDYLDPRYPETRPVELLLALAAELAGYSSSRTQLHSLRRFEDAAAALHESLAGSGAGTVSGTASATGGGPGLERHPVPARSSGCWRTRSTPSSTTSGNWAVQSSSSWTRARSWPSCTRRELPHPRWSGRSTSSSGSAPAPTTSGCCSRDGGGSSRRPAARGFPATSTCPRATT